MPTSAATPFNFGTTCGCPSGAIGLRVLIDHPITEIPPDLLSSLIVGILWVTTGFDAFKVYGVEPGEPTAL
jgi:hypothetical protein